MFILLIKSPVSHAGGNAILQTGVIFRNVAEKIQVPPNFWHRAEISSFEGGEDNPEQRRNMILSLGI